MQRMETLPLELLMEIATTDESIYFAMLAIPHFARSMTVSRRMDVRVAFGHTVRITRRGCDWRRNGRMHRLDGPARTRPGIFEWYRRGRLHRPDGPARVTKDVTEWYRHGVLHRRDGPARKNSTIREYWRNGVLHRIGGPAVYTTTVRFEYDESTRHLRYRGVTTSCWIRNGELHRKSGPAIESTDGLREWWSHGKRHRENGPAIITSNGFYAWYRNGAMELAYRKHDGVIEYTNELTDHYYSSL